MSANAKPTPADIAKILDAHKKWLAGEDGGARADFRGANLRDAYFSYANLSYADLSGADLSHADLSGADLSGADLSHAKFPSAYAIPRVENLDEKILDAVTAEPASFSMGNWHSTTTACGTSHCRAGWAITLAGAAGKALEDRLGASLAGALIYVTSTGRVPDFFCDDITALADIRLCAAQAKVPHG